MIFLFFKIIFNFFLQGRKSKLGQITGMKIIFKPNLNDIT